MGIKNILRMGVLSYWGSKGDVQILGNVKE